MRFRVFLLLLFLSTPSLAALPPVDDQSRQERASTIFEGEILRIYSREDLKSEDSSNQQLVLQIRVLDTTKDTLKQGSLVYVHCWVPGKRPRHWVGDSGQRPRPREGDTGLFFARRTPNGNYQLIHPNGWERR